MDANQRLMQFMEAVSRSTDAKVLKAEQTAEEEAEQILLDSGVVIPMSTAFATNFVRKDLISGWETNPLDIHPFKEISLN